MIFPSPSYPAVGLTKLLDRLECNIILTAKQFDIVSKLSHEGRRTIHQIPGLSELLDEVYPHYPFDKTFESARSEPLVVVHTSGTTGVPKPLIYTHDWVASWIQQNQLAPPEGYVSLEHLCHGIEICSVAPANHVSFPSLCVCLFTNRSRQVAFIRTFLQLYQTKLLCCSHCLIPRLHLLLLWR